MFARIRKLLVAQLLLLGSASVAFFVVSGGFQAGSVWFGGCVALANVLLLQWRRYQADTGRALDAQQSLRLLYRSALERLVVVIALLLLGLAVLRLDPLALLTGFIVGQAALFVHGLQETA